LSSPELVACAFEIADFTGNPEEQNMKLLSKLTETPGLSGREERIRAVIEQDVAGLFDDIRTDAMGNLICRRQPRGKRREAGRPLRVLLAGHMDEIGFYVSHVDKKTGFLRLQNVGGFDTRTLLARRVVVQTESGDLHGVMFAGRPIHVMSEDERKKIPDMDDIFVDLMTNSKKVAGSVRVGDPVTLWQPMSEIGDACVGKAMDNRIAHWVIINAVRQAAARHRCEIIYAATVQEEVGLRGAQTAAFGAEADVGIAVDSTIAADTPGVPENKRVVAWGGGVALKVMDQGSITHRGLLDEWIAIAKEKRIKHQLEILPRGATDAGALQRSRGGVKAGTISVPVRYVHTVTEAINKNDVKAAVHLLASYLEQAK
jgi:tetrahedral aminopeptidase